MNDAAISSPSSSAAAVAAIPPPGEVHPFDKFVRFRVLGVMLPSVALTWVWTGGRLLVSLASAFVLPCLAVAQGATGILKYRLLYGDAPRPVTPCHGVVIVRQESSSVVAPAAAASNNPPPSETATTTSPPFAGGESLQTRQDPQSQFKDSKIPSRTNRLDSQTSSDSLEEESSIVGNSTHKNNDSSNTQEQLPVRLLVMGDSLAIGVGQSQHGFPVLPEVVAKTLSKYLNGRTVYWTCHGAPGASTGWIVRELTRGVAYMEQQQQQHHDEDEDEHDDICHDVQTSNCAHHALASQLDIANPLLEKAPSRLSRYASFSDTDESSLDESASLSSLSDSSPRPRQQQQQQQQPQKVWRERLAQHRKRFDPKAMGPYDVVVVVTGSNDVKSEYFPFLLRGEDAEFWREAKERGGDYAKELKRVLQTLDRGMRLQLRSIRDSVEAATETVLELAEETMERLGSVKGGNADQHHFGSSFREKLEARREASQAALMEAIIQEEYEKDSKDEALTKHFPLVVLPGLPARALPLFRKAPLRWLAVPALDIHAMHQRSVALSHPSQVLFVPPPSIDDLATYENCKGELWRQRCEEDTVMAYRDIRPAERRRIESEMRDYYRIKDPRRPTGHGLQKTGMGWFSSWFPRAAAPGTSMFSVGRYIASAIVEEWRAHPERQPPSLQ